MKKIIVGMIFIICSFSVNASSISLAFAKVDDESSITEELIKLFSAEAIKVGSPLNKLITDLRNDPDNESHHVEDFITKEDVLFIESFGHQGRFEMRYLIVLRAGYKSSTYPLIYLTGVAVNNSEENDIDLQISGPTKVVIE